MTVWTPLERTLTVEMLPVVVMAALGSWRTLLALWTMTATWAVMPSLTVEGGLVSATVTG